jgi:acetolactate synthase-1/2/3 large subunit
MNVSQAIVQGLESIGVDCIFTGSGQGSGELLFACHDAKKLRTIMVRNEQAAAFMACGYSMFSDKLGVCSAQGGPGAFNLFSGMAVALSDSLPILSIASYTPPYWRNFGDLGETTGTHRVPNGPAMYAATTKKAYLVEKPAEALDILEDAVNVAFEGRPGPVHIDLPYDVARTEIPNPREIKLTIKPVTPAPKRVEQFAEVLARAIAEKKKILAWVGYGCIRSHAESDLLAFVERFQLPFMHTMDAKGVLPEDHPLSVGMSGVSGDPGAKRAFKEAELVLVIGTSLAKWACWRFQEGIFDDKVLMHINIDEKAMNRAYAADYVLVSDAKRAVVALTEALSKRVGKVEKRKLVIDKVFSQKIEPSKNKVNPGLLCKEISRLLPDRAIVLGDAGSHMLWLAAFMQFTRGQIYQNPGSFGPMAAHINAALGVQLANPDRRVIVGCGDGGYLMSGFELLTAVEQKVPLIWIIFDNGEFNIIKLFHLNAHKREVLNHFLNPDYVKYAEACGANGYRVENVKDFAPAFQAALKSDKPSLIDVRTDPDAVPPFAFYND